MLTIKTFLIASQIICFLILLIVHFKEGNIKPFANFIIAKLELGNPVVSFFCFNIVLIFVPSTILYSILIALYNKIANTFLKSTLLYDSSNKRAISIKIVGKDSNDNKIYRVKLYMVDKDNAIEHVKTITTTDHVDKMPVDAIIRIWWV